MSARAFAEYVRPQLAARLRAIGLDVVYHRARGDRLYYREPQDPGQDDGDDGDDGDDEVEVLDFVGGFGASLLGHNHPELVARARELLAAERPFHAQASIRATTGRLGERLSQRVGRATGRRYVVTFANSGAEAVEAAIKHAEMERRGRIDRILTGFTARTHEVRRRLRDQSAHLSDALFDRAARLFGLAHITSLDELFFRVYRATLDALEQPPVFLAVEGAFHGKTSGSLQLTHRPEYQAPWRSLGPRSVFVPAGDLSALEQVLAHSRVRYLDLDIDADGSVDLAEREFINIAACFYEPIQGEGGVRELEAEYQEALRQVADRAGAPLVIDEIQSGMGRTGAFLASEAHGVRGDYYLLSKSLGGGLAKISALLVDRDRYLDDFGFLHTSTFADDDFSSAVALATLDIIERDDDQVLRLCRERGQHLMDRLTALRDRYPDQIAAVRGRGLMIGVELCSQGHSPAPLMRLLGDQDLLGFFVSGYLLHEHRVRVAPTLSARATIRLEPSAFVTERDIERFCRAFEDLLQVMERSDMHRLARFAVGRAREPDAPEPAHREPAALPDRGAAPRGTRVGFLTHFLEPGDVRDWDPSLAPWTEDQCDAFLERTRGLIDPFIAARPQLTSATGATVEATVIGLPFTPAQVVDSMRRGSGEWAVQLIERGVELARQIGCVIVGFGGYTSILTNNCRAIAASDLALTSGNSLTAAAALEALFMAADRLGIDERRLGVVGAAGNIGMVLAEVAAEDVDSLVLVGRERALPRLERAAERLRAQMAGRGRGRAPDLAIDVTSDMTALRDCTLILTASNSARPIIHPEHVGEHPVVISDVAVPRDVAPSVAGERPGATLLRGGIVCAPDGQTVDIRGMNLAPGEIYGCLAETMLLGCAQIGESFSYGPLQASKVRRVRALARQHGFIITENPSLASEAGR